MLKKAVVFAATHKLASAAFILLPFVGTVVAAGILAYQNRQRVTALGTAWRH